MVTKEEYAQLSLYVYNAIGLESNRPLEPAGWQRLDYQPTGFAGFSYGIFRRTGTNEVVIAYAGTQIDDAGDILNDIGAGLGVASTQTTNAAVVYLNAKRLYGPNISFTGHSLGGGLASVMAVWFDRGATVFDEAPFELIARNPLFVSATKAALALVGLSDPAFTGYTGLLDFYTRETQVTNHYMEGEALAALRVALPTVVGQDNLIRANVADMTIAGSIDLHSQALLTAMLMSDSFRQSTYASTRVIPLLMDKNLYAHDAATSNQQNVLINFIRSEQGTGDKLTHFAADLQKLGANIAGLNKAAQDALIAQGIEWYYWQSATYDGREFFAQNGQLLQYTTAMGDGLAGAQNKAAPYVQKWLAPIANAHGEYYSASMANYQQWNVAAGSSGVTGTARDGTKSQIFVGGSGADSFAGGQVADLMFAGDGADTLDGGDGNDQLFGGLGNDLLRGGNGDDSYVMEGQDIIEDSDGRGTIQDKNGKRIAGVVEKRGDGSYVFASDFTVTVTVSGGADLALTLAEGDSVVIKGFKSGDLGLRLSDTTTAPPPTTRTLTGTDQDDALNDGIFGGVYANEVIRGLGGNDNIASFFGGDDRIEGGDGNDWLLGGMGNDLVIGGAGRDVLVEGGDDDKLYADGVVTVADAIAAENATPTGLPGEALSGGSGDDLAIGGAGNDVLLGGIGDDILVAGAGDDNIDGDAMAGNISPDWSVVRNIITDAGGATAYNPVYTLFNVYWPTAGGADDIYAGAGADWVNAGYGNDYVDGGNDDDVLWGEGGNDGLFGGSGDDIIMGDNASLPLAVHGDDYLDGEDGVDTLFGEGGQDRLFGGTGADGLYGQEGDDYVDGEDGDDTLVGGAGADRLFGGAGADFLQGDAGNGAGDGADYLDGEAGDDILLGLGGSDELHGGDGADQIAGDNGGVDTSGTADTIYGEAGNDLIDGQGGDDIIDAGADNDTVAGGAGADNLNGGLGNDQLQGGSGDDAVSGNEGNDVLFGEDGNDRINGDEGIDTLIGGDGADILDGGAGDDILLGQNGNDTLFGGDGADQIAGDNADAGGNDAIYSGAGADTIDGGGGDDLVFAGADNDNVAGGAGADNLNGGLGNDVLFGQAGNDTLLGGAGNDSLIGGLGNDILDGGEGDDVYFYASGDGNDRIVDSGGTDWLVFNNHLVSQIRLGTGSLKLTLPDGAEIHLDDFDPDNPYAAGGIDYFQFADGAVMSKTQLIGSLGIAPTGTPEADDLGGTALSETIQALAGDDIVTARAGNDSVYADDGADVVYAGDGNDIVYGGNGDDVLLGEAGDDTLHGEAGNDLLAGGAGADQLLGGEGDDSYLFQPGDGQDTATDALGHNLIVLGAGLTADAIVFSRRDGDLLVSVKNSTDRLTVRDWFAADSHFAGITLGDGTTLDHAGVEAAMPRNQAPVASPDSATVVEDGPVSVSGNALANDSDPEGRSLRVTNPGSYAGSLGTLSLAGNGAWSYGLANNSTAVQSLAAGQTLSEDFAYSVSDDDPDGAATAASRITVTVQGTNDLPLPGADSAATAEDAAPIMGNVLANDSDIDAGAALAVADAGTRTGSYGSLTLGGDGAWSYGLANASAAVQALAAGQSVTEDFAFAVSDGIDQVGGHLAIRIAGMNDAPGLAAPLADQAAVANRSWSWQVPAGSFADADAGDALSHGATLADGSPLPSWLTFDAATLTFSGRVPRTATGNIDIRVSATDRLAASAGDVFNLSFDGSTSGGGGGGGGNGGGNEGVGNGEDAPPPGHDASFNDGPGTGPGNPGAQGGDGYRPPSLADIATTRVVIATPILEEAGPASAHGHSAPALAAALGQARQVASATMAAGTDQDAVAPAPTLAANTGSAAEAAAGTNAAAPGGEADALAFDAWLSALDAAMGGEFQARAAAHDNANGMARRWAAIDAALAAHLAQPLDDALGIAHPGRGAATGSPNASPFLATANDPLALLAANTSLQQFQGLKEGIGKIAR